MEEIYVNVEQVKPVNTKYSTNHTAPTSSEKSSYLSVTIFLGVLSAFLLVGLIVLGVYYHNSVHDSAAELSAIKDNLTEFLQTSNDKFSSMTEERDLLKANLTEMTKELEMLQRLSKQKKTCPAGWKMFSCSCYFLSEKSGSWDQGRQDCRAKGADLVVIGSSEEQVFLSDFTKRYTWIGLSDRDNEKTWKWVDGSPLTLKYWDTNQPDNGGGIPKYGEEDCVHIRNEATTSWNDVSCASRLPWICEKIP